jgi:hypothetical protein
LLGYHLQGSKLKPRNTCRPLGLIVAGFTFVRLLCQTSHLRIAFGFAEAATGSTLSFNAGISSLLNRLYQTEKQATIETICVRIAGAFVIPGMDMV